jgi:UDP-glucuronate 4-epimerase
MQDGDVPATYADTTEIAREVGFSAGMPVDEGLRRFVDWYRSYMNG